MTDETSTPISPPDAARRLRLHLKMLWYAPMLCGRFVRGARANVDADVERWITITGIVVPPAFWLAALLATYPEFRTLYCYRLRRAGTIGAVLGTVLKTVYPGERTLHL